jgi:hypothetical protein
LGADEAERGRTGRLHSADDRGRRLSEDRAWRRRLVGARHRDEPGPVVTHNIKEAVAMCDRILVLDSDPGHIAAQIPVSLPQPRNRLDAAFHAILDEIYAILTSNA